METREEARKAAETLLERARAAKHILEMLADSARALKEQMSSVQTINYISEPYCLDSYANKVQGLADRLHHLTEAVDEDGEPVEDGPLSIMRALEGPRVEWPRGQTYMLQYFDVPGPFGPKVGVRIVDSEGPLELTSTFDSIYEARRAAMKEIEMHERDKAEESI